MDRRSFIIKSGIGAASVLASPFYDNSLLAMNAELTKAAFGKDFKWGVATAAYQIEGAYNADGKGPSVWDMFSHKRKKIKDRSNGDVSCDFYHNYQKDIGLIKAMNFDVFRFSTSWSRILPDGIGRVNQKGLDFYDRVIDQCLATDVEPWITLYHWDLPLALHEKGGWMNRDVISWFAEYSELVCSKFGDRVKNWMVLNEPVAYTVLGYFLGINAPGLRKPKGFLKSVHHTSMCQAEGSRIIRSTVKDSNVGTTFSCSHVQPKNYKKRHIKAADRMNILLNRLFLEPALGMGYPTEGFKFLSKIEKYVKPGDEAKLKCDLDFVGLQNYTRFVARHFMIPYSWALEVPPAKRGISKENLTDMGWEVYPEGIYDVIKQFAAYENMPPIIVTENGCAFPDKIENNQVHDEKRIQFFKDYLGQVLRAKNEGVDLRGYFVWTLMDNFEWAEGYETEIRSDTCRF